MLVYVDVYSPRGIAHVGILVQGTCLQFPMNPEHIVSPLRDGPGNIGFLLEEKHDENQTHEEHACAICDPPSVSQNQHESLSRQGTSDASSEAQDGSLATQRR